MKQVFQHLWVNRLQRAKTQGPHHFAAIGMQVFRMQGEVGRMPESKLDIGLFTGYIQLTERSVFVLEERYLILEFQLDRGDLTFDKLLKEEKYLSIGVFLMENVVFGWVHS